MEPMPSRSALPLIFLHVLLTACTPGQTPPATADGPAPRFTVQTSAGLREYEWQGDEHLKQILVQASGKGGATLAFSPGVFEFSSGINLPGAKDLHFRGQAGTVFRFRKLDEWGLIRTVEETRPTDNLLIVDRGDLMKPSRRYQLFLPDQRGGRFLECVVRSVESSKVNLSWFSVTHPDLKVIPSGAYVLPEINFFDSFRGSGLSFTGIVFDGNCDVTSVKLEGRPFYGHTMHSGIILRNLYRPPEPHPARRDAVVADCSFRNLLGRAVVVYNMSAITVRDCDFEAIRTEALEIDHWASEAIVRGCRFRKCATAIQLNDCNQTVISECQVTDCDNGLRILDALKDRSTNRGISIRGNMFIDNRKAIHFDPFADENSVTGNHFINCGAVAVILGGDRNLFSDNVITGSTVSGVEYSGPGSVIEGNLIVPPGNAAGFSPVRRFN